MITDKNAQQTFKPLLPPPHPVLPSPPPPLTQLVGANVQAYGEMCYMRSLLSQGFRLRSLLPCLCCPTSSCSSSLSTPTLAMSQARQLNGDVRTCGRSGVELIETFSMAAGPLQDICSFVRWRSRCDEVNGLWAKGAHVAALLVPTVFWSCLCQNASLLSCILHFLNGGCIEVGRIQVAVRDVKKAEMKRSRLFFSVNVMCDIIIKCHCGPGHDFNCCVLFVKHLYQMFPGKKNEGV